MYLAKILARLGPCALAGATGALQVRKLPPEVVHRRRIHEVGLVVAPTRQVVCQHVRMVLQDLTVDQLPDLPEACH